MPSMTDEEREEEHWEEQWFNKYGYWIALTLIGLSFIFRKIFDDDPITNWELAAIFGSLAYVNIMLKLNEIIRLMRK
jgi:hypothetical protein